MPPRTALAACLPALCLLSRFALAADSAVIDSMDAPTFSAPAGKAQVSTVDGHEGKALQFQFPANAQSVFATARARATPAWDQAQGISFWVKGDGSEHLGGLQLIWNENYGLRYDYAFPISHTGWKKIVVPWRDLIPVLPSPEARPLDPAGGNAPSKVSQIWFGKWWYWRDYAAHSYAVDELRLEASIPQDARDFKPAGAPLSRVLAKLKAGQPVTIVTMGDSLTDYAHWANRETNWPTLLKQALKEKFHSDATIVNPAIGGTQLRQNLVLLPRWIAAAPEPDLVTVFFGGNDWDAGMRGPMFMEAQKDAVERIRRATNGKADVLLLTTCPGAERWDTVAELAEAVRKAASEANAGLADVYAAFHAAGASDRTALFVKDKVHLSPAGHQTVAQTVLQAVESAGARP